MAAPPATALPASSRLVNKRTKGWLLMVGRSRSQSADSKADCIACALVCVRAEAKPAPSREGGLPATVSFFFSRHCLANERWSGDKEAVLKGRISPTATPTPVETGRMVLLLDCNAESEAPSYLLEAGTDVNIPANTVGQDPAHLAAYGGHAFFLLWQRQTGANLNQQDWLGEAPIHKAAKVGSLECLTLLVASNVISDLRNKKGQTAEDLALASGFWECAQFLMTVKETQHRKATRQESNSLSNSDGLLTEALTRQKRASESRRSISKKTRRSNDAMCSTSCESG